MKPTIIFDMDGVLINTEESFVMASLMTYEHFTGKKLSCERFGTLKLIGKMNNDWDALDYLFRTEGYDVTYSQIMDYYQGIFYGDDNKGLIDNEKLIVNIEFFEQLSKNYNLTIFTGRLEADALFTLDKFNIRKYFSIIVTFDQVGIACQKPDCKGVNIIKSQVNSQKIYYLGDSVDDAKAAKDSGVFGIGVLPPQDKSDILRAKLLDAGAQIVISNTLELQELLAKEPTTV